MTIYLINLDKHVTSVARYPSTHEVPENVWQDCKNGHSMLIDTYSHKIYVRGEWEDTEEPKLYG